MAGSICGLVHGSFTFEGHVLESEFYWVERERLGRLRVIQLVEDGLAEGLDTASLPEPGGRADRATREGEDR